MIEPKNGEWWMCDRGGVNAVFLRLENDWRGDNNDTYSFGDAIPLYRMTEDKPISPKAPVNVEYERAKYSRVSDAIAAHESGVKFKQELPDGDFTDYLSWFELCECYANNYKIVVEIEKPVDERQEFIETCMKNTNLRARDGATEVFGSLYVAGCRFLQE